MHLCETRNSTMNSDAAFTITLAMRVDDPQLLWDAAAEKAMRAPGATVSTMVDTLGPREDPAIADCIAMLTAPTAIAGCALEDYGVTARAAAPVPGSLASPHLTLMSANG